MSKTRRQDRINVPLPAEALARLEELANVEKRPTANLASVLLQAAIELMEEQGYRLVEGQLRKLPEE